MGPNRRETENLEIPRYQRHDDGKQRSKKEKLGDATLLA